MILRNDERLPRLKPQQVKRGQHIWHYARVGDHVRARAAIVTETFSQGARFRFVDDGKELSAQYHLLAAREGDEHPRKPAPVSAPPEPVVERREKRKPRHEPVRSKPFENIHAHVQTPPKPKETPTPTPHVTEETDDMKRFLTLRSIRLDEGALVIGDNQKSSGDPYQRRAYIVFREEEDLVLRNVARQNPETGAWEPPDRRGTIQPENMLHILVLRSIEDAPDYLEPELAKLVQDAFIADKLAQEEEYKRKRAESAKSLLIQKINNLSADDLERLVKAMG